MKYWAKKFRNIIITGMPAAGKTTFGKIYAFHSGRVFLDFDKYVEQGTRMSICDWFALKGEVAFRAAEERGLYKLERRRNTVIAMGGGTLLKPEHIDFAKKIGLVVMLKADLQLLGERIFARKEKLPLFAGCKTRDDVDHLVLQLWQMRKESYEQADLVMDTATSSMDNLKLQLSLIERRASRRDYLQDVFNATKPGSDLLQN